MSTKSKTPESENEELKRNSQGLRGSLKKSLTNVLTAALDEQDVQLIKFHGIYQQDNRDRRLTRQGLYLEPEYSFMMRVRIPAGILTPKQILVCDSVCETYGIGDYKVTTRQTVQFHGIAKHHLPLVVQQLVEVGLDSIATCGDVNRNITTSAWESSESLSREVQALARDLSNCFLPTSKAYDEIFLKVDPEPEPEPDQLYQDCYLPRKFKTAIAIPPINDCDVYSNDLGLITTGQSQIENLTLVVGGGLGHTFGNDNTYPRLGQELGSFPKSEVFKIMRAVLEIQRDYGNRHDRKLARLKHTYEKLGKTKFISEVENRSSVKLLLPEHEPFKSRVDTFGWSEQEGCSWLCILVPSGRVSDKDIGYRSFIREVAKLEQLEFQLTCSQNIIIKLKNQKIRKTVEALITLYKILITLSSKMAEESFACASFPNCPLAFAEGERALPSIKSQIETLLAKHGILNHSLSLRISGCANSCARPGLAEIGLIGKALGRYNLYLGADRVGLRLNCLYRESITVDEIINELDALFASFIDKRSQGESFGDFCLRSVKFK